MNYILIFYPDLFCKEEQEMGRFDTYAEAEEARIYWQERYGVRENDFSIEEVED